MGFGVAAFEVCQDGDVTNAFGASSWHEPAVWAGISRDGRPGAREAPGSALIQDWRIQTSFPISLGNWG